MVNNSRQLGFTIVELLIVIVVIGVLAAIVIVAYNGITNSAEDAAIESDLSNIAKKMEVYRVTKSTTGAYPDNVPADLEEVKLKLNHGAYDTTRNNVFYCNSADSYAIGAVGKNDSGYFLVNGDLQKIAGTNIWMQQTCDQIGVTTADGRRGFTFGSGWEAWTE